MGAITGGGIGLLLSAFAILMMVLQGSTTITFRGGASIPGVGAIALYLGGGLVGGAALSAMRRWLKNRLAAYLIGSLMGAAFMYGTMSLATGLPRSPTIDALSIGIFALTLGGFVGLQVRGAIFED